MISFTALLTHLQAVIAVRAARDRTLTVLLVALCGRIARMGTRLERLIARWRAGKLPVPRAPRGADTRVRAPGGLPKFIFPTAQGWLLRKLGYEVATVGSQLRHLLTEAECAEFLAAVPQAGRILRPLLQMLSVDPLPEVIVLRAKLAVPMAPRLADGVAITIAPAVRFLRA